MKRKLSPDDKAAKLARLLASPRCQAKTRYGKPCKQAAMRGKSLCKTHATPAARRYKPHEHGPRCESITHTGKRCKQPAMRGKTACKTHEIYGGSPSPQPGDTEDTRHIALDTIRRAVTAAA
jgi:hypothetical protein